MTVRAPIRQVLATEREIDADRLWSRVRMRRMARRRARARLVALAGTALLVVLVVLGVRVRGRSVEVSALLSADGTVVTPLAAEPVLRTLALSDGSRVELGPGASLVPRQNSDAAFEVALEGGTATFDVRPGGTRRWIIDCGVATVEVLGTRFVVDASSSSEVRVSVERGRVRMTSRDRARIGELGAGESIVVGPTAAAPPNEFDASVSETRTTEASPGPAESARVQPSAKQNRAGARWRELASRGDYGAAYDDLGEKGLSTAAREASVDDLLALADVARLSGHPEDAVDPLERAMQSTNSPRAPLAAFTLGRLELDTLRRPARAANAFARAVELGLPRGLVEDAYARLVEARSRAGDARGARAAFESYAREFPDGKRASGMQRWLTEQH